MHTLTASSIGKTMKKLSYIGCVSALVLALGLGSTALAQPQQNAGYPTKFAQAGMTFLKIDVGSRIASMGGTNASVEGSANDMFANPAGMAFVEGFDATTTVTNWIADIKHYGGGAAYTLGNIGTFGVSFVAMDYGDFTRTVPYEGADPVKRNQGYLDLGTFQVNEIAIGLAYARQITSQFYIGGHVRHVSQDLGEVTIYDELQGQNIDSDWQVSNIAFDFGTMYYTGWKDLRFGMSLRNFSNQNDYYNQRFELPLTFDFGVAMDVLPLFTQASNQKLLVVADWQHPRDFAERFNVGAEYGMMDAFFVRGGYKFDLSETAVSEEDFSLGLGAKFDIGGNGIRADYAYTAFGDFFGQVHRITIGVFGLK